MLYVEPWTAVYVRVSSGDQSFRSQEADLKRHAAACDGGVCWYSDKASGTTMDRPEWNRLWEDVITGHVSRIVVWRLDRLGRTAAGLTQLFDDLNRRKVGLISIKDGLDITTPVGRMVAGILANIAQFETEVRTERQRAGIAAAKSAGVKFGRPGGSGRPLKVTAEHRKLIPHLKAGGSSVAGIARATGLSRDTVYEVLKATTSG